MARDAQQTIQDKVRHLRERYANSVGEKLIEINAAYDQLVGELGGDDPTVAIDGLATPIHKMAGSAPTFGLADLGEIAAEMEEVLLSCKENPDAFSKEKYPN